MKKNLVLGGVVVALAMGSAVAFSNTALTQVAYVKVKQTASQSSYTNEAVNLPDGTCNGLSATNCRVNILLSPSGNASTTAYSDAAGTIPFKDNSANATIYDIVPSWNPVIVAP